MSGTAPSQRSVGNSPIRVKMHSKDFAEHGGNNSSVFVLPGSRKG